VTSARWPACADPGDGADLPWTKTTPVCLPCKRERDKQYKLDNPEKVANRTSEKRKAQASRSG
jgi:hypothetical protein